MKRRDYLILYIAGLLVAIIATAYQSVPGYMDAEYYFGTARQLADGNGFVEPFLWHYLDEPAGLPHPSHLYWMPLPSLLSAAGMIITGSRSYLAGRLFFILLAGLLPVLTACLAVRMTGRRDHAWLAGGLAAVPGFYMVYLTTTETFLPYLLLGAGLLLFSFPSSEQNMDRWWTRALICGLLAGLMHLTRADGLMWLVFTAGLGLFQPLPKAGARFFPAMGWAGLVLAAYLLVMAPWYVRNIQLFEGPFVPGTSRTLWLTDYDQTFSFPADQLTSQMWLNSGWDAILSARWSALIANLKNVLAVQLEIFLAPLALIGLWSLRRKPGALFGILMWLLTLGVMTVVFPFAGWRGGFIHSGSAVQALFWVAAAVGLDRAIRWMAAKRKWPAGQAVAVFSWSAMAMATAFTGFIFFNVVIGPDPENRAWEDSSRRQQTMDVLLAEAGADEGEIIMAIDPPGVFVHTNRSAIAIPYGDESDALAAAKAYGARYLLLEKDHPDGYRALYQSPGDRNGWDYLGSLDGIHLFRRAGE